jgi:transcription elongation GreA/GreB family factor
LGFAHAVPAPAPINKDSVRHAILRHLQAELTLLAGAVELARDEASNEESRARSKYDTHSQEAAYLAEGQGRVAAEIEESLRSYAALTCPTFPPDAPIALGALVELGAPGKTARYFLGPRAGGIEVTVDGQSILVVTPQSPLGRSLLGQRAGDTLTAAGRAKPQRIVSVA